LQPKSIRSRVTRRSLLPARMALQLRLNGLYTRSFFAQGGTMLSWALTFLIVAILAGILGFGGIAGTATWIAHTLFVIFIVLFLFSLLLGRRV